MRWFWAVEGVLTVGVVIAFIAYAREDQREWERQFDERMKRVGPE